MKPATFTPEVRVGILYRDGGRCGMAGMPGCRGVASTHPNHRQNRGAGGSRHAAANTPANGCGICDPCNVAIEADADMREEALRRGVKLTRGQDPEVSPLWSVFYGQWIVPRSGGALLTGVRDAGLDARVADAWMPAEVGS